MSELENKSEITEAVATPAPQAEAPKTDAKPFNKDGRPPFNKGGNRDGKRPPRRDREVVDDGLLKKVVAVNRVTKVVKGGKNMRFTALVVVGDGKGKVGYGMGKANEVSGAIEKANTQAKRYMMTVPQVGTTIPHQINGRFNKSNVLLMPASEGTGVIAGSSVRAVLEVAGIKDIRTKSLGSRNPVNVVKATIEGLKGLTTVERAAYLRGKTVEEILG